MRGKLETRAGHYVIGEKLASGGTAMLFRGQLHSEADWSRPVIIKRLLPPYLDSPEYIELIRNEAKLYSKLSHPNILQIYDYIELDGSPCLILEPIEGIDLKCLLKKLDTSQQQITLASCFSLFYRLACAIQYLHKSSLSLKRETIIHRDISPDNILISWQGDIKIADFGVALELPPKMQQRAEEKIIWGKREYASPEQLAGEKVDQRSDIYSLGVVIAEVSQSLQERKEIRALISCCTNRDPNLRFSSCDSLIKEIFIAAKEMLTSGENEFKQLLQQLYPKGLEPKQPQTKPTTKMAVTCALPLKKKRNYRLTLLVIILLLTVLFLFPKKLVENFVVDKEAVPITSEKESNNLPIEGKALLSITSKPLTTVYLNGKRYGKTPLKELAVPPGQYRISYISPYAKKMIEHLVTVKKGEKKEIHQTFDRKKIKGSKPF